MGVLKQGPDGDELTEIKVVYYYPLVKSSNPDALSS
jgi:hypothetical protein